MIYSKIIIDNCEFIYKVFANYDDGAIEIVFRNEENKMLFFSKSVIEEIDRCIEHFKYQAFSDVLINNINNNISVIINRAYDKNEVSTIQTKENFYVLKFREDSK